MSLKNKLNIMDSHKDVRLLHPDAENIGPTDMSSVFRDDLEAIEPTNVEKSVTHAILQVPSKLIIKPPVKIQLAISIEYITPNDETLTVWVSTKQQAVISRNDFNNKTWPHEMLNQFNSVSEEAKLRGSGWSEGTVKQIKLKQTKYTPIAGKTYIPLPKALADKKAVLNIKNSDDKCFMWCVLAKLHYFKKNAERTSNYSKFVDELNLDGITFPVSIEQVETFEQQNNLSINVYTWSETENLQPLRVSKDSPTIGNPDERHVDLLLYMQHYTLIRTMSRLLGFSSKDEHKQDFCRRCLVRIPSIQAALKHREHCSTAVDYTTTLVTPKPGDKVCFKNLNKLQMNPYVVYADFESLIVPYEGPVAAELPKTVSVSNHQVCSYAFIIVRSDGQHSKPELYRGQGAASSFLERMKNVRNDLVNKLNLQELKMTEIDQQNYESAQCCWICKGDLNGDKVRDHDHISGAFRGAAHNKCNLQLKCDPKTWKLPVFFHNLRGYDSHLIMQAVTNEHRCKCIAQSSEKYMTFTLNYLSFYDSAQHLMGTLESLAGSLSSYPITQLYFDASLVKK